MALESYEKLLITDVKVDLQLEESQHLGCDELEDISPVIFSGWRTVLEGNHFVILIAAEYKTISTA
ncbi:hypothetical protein AC578_5263 [Pseudocercospora eumusae]|uniref:Uncharacterized protein n=1 Tax=Pseudocercospora eumusae TaxID=321146 RepID=A0A139GZF1_9PEZI|nr:hypothetical protein AC578_5263 [Pseudocercospora eumusae]